MLGDERIFQPSQEVTQTTDICAPSGRVWRWLAQMMRGAGLYGWPALESANCRSADYLLQDLPPPRVGDRVGDIFALVAVEPQAELVWQTCNGLQVLGLPLKHLTLDYRLTPLESHGVRLTTRLRVFCPVLTATQAATLISSK